MLFMSCLRLQNFECYPMTFVFLLRKPCLVVSILLFLFVNKLLGLTDSYAVLSTSFSFHISVSFSAKSNCVGLLESECTMFRLSFIHARVILVQGFFGLPTLSQFSLPPFFKLFYLNWNTACMSWKIPERSHSMIYKGSS